MTSTARTSRTRGVTPQRGTSPAFEFVDAGVRMGGRWIWENIDLVVGQGEFVAILGPNGAGKSTLIKAALGVLPLSEGTLRVLGQPARRGNPSIGYLPQRRSFDADLRIRGRDLVRLGWDGSRWGIPIPWIGSTWRNGTRRVDDVAEMVGATELLPRPIGELSGGEQQRLLIAQALVAQPSILLLDEPLDSLDISNQQAISSLVHTICREQNVTVGLVAHDVNPILPYLDRVIYIAGGRAVAGAPEEVITSETLSALYGSQIDVLTTTSGRLVVVGQPEAATFHGQHH